MNNRRHFCHVLFSGTDSEESGVWKFVLTRLVYLFALEDISLLCRSWYVFLLITGTERRSAAKDKNARFISE